MIRVLLADDHAMVRAGLSLLIRCQSDMEVAGEAEDAAAAIRLAAELQPDVAVLDISMPPGRSGLEVISKVDAVGGGCRILVLTMHDDYAYLRAAMVAGSAGYVVKSAADEELIQAIRTIHGGRTFFSATMSPEEIQTLQEATAGADDGAEISLSARETQVLEFVVYGYTSQQIAEHLHLSVKTIDGYRSRLMEKLDIRRRADLVRYALKKGIVHAERLYPRDYRFESTPARR